MRLMQGRMAMKGVMVMVMVMVSGVDGFQAPLTLSGRGSRLSTNSHHGLHRMPLKLRGPACASKRFSLLGRKGGSSTLRAAESGMEEKDISTNEIQFIDSSERCLVVLPIEEDVKSRNIECEVSRAILSLSPHPRADHEEHHLPLCQRESVC